MLSWILLTLVTTLLWAFNNVFDQIAITQYVKNEFRYSFWFYVARLPVFFILILLFGVEVPSNTILGLTMFSAFLSGCAFLFYYRAMRLAQAYVVALLYVSLHPLFVLLIQSAYWGSTMSLAEYGGFFLLLCAGVLSVLEFDKKISINKGALWVVPATVIWSLGDVVWDYVIQFYSRPVNVLPWIALGAFFITFLFLVVPTLRKKSLDTSVPVPRAGYMIFLVTLLAVFVSYGTFAQALSTGDVALTSAMTAIQPLFVFLIGLGVARYLGKMSMPALNVYALMPKLAALIFAVAGVYFIAT